MAKFIISRGLRGGEIEVFGAKNAAIKMIAASLLLSGRTILDNVPDILDIRKIIQIIEKLGVKCLRSGHRLIIDTTNLRPGEPDPRHVGAIRASVVLAGPLLARFGNLRLPHPGGCTIGQRPIDRHLKAFEDLGVKISQKNGFYEFSYDRPENLNDAIVRFKEISVTATENVLLFAALESRRIIIENAAIEPEIIDLIEFLKYAGVKIRVRARRIEIKGRASLKEVRYRVMPDRIEAGTFAILAAAANVRLKITHINPQHLEALLGIFKQMGVKFALGRDFLYIDNSPELMAVNISTAPYPGFPTDLEPPMAVLLSRARGRSIIRENVFEHRLGYLRELNKMGAKAKIMNSQKAEIIGPTELHGAKIDSLDLRAGATLLIAGLIAQGKTEIFEAENIDRGYEKIEERLAKIGANIKRIK